MPLVGYVLMASSDKKGAGGTPAITAPPKAVYKRFRWLEIKLYCDNPYHVKLFYYLQEINQYQGCHILHDSDIKDDGTSDKPHWHVTLYSDTRQVSCKHVGGGRYLAESWAKSFGTYDAIVDSNGKPVIYLSSKSSVDCSLPASADSIRTFPILSDAAGINDPSQWLLYMTHSDFNSMLNGKHRYEQDRLVIWSDSPTIYNYLTNSYNVSCASGYELFEYADGVYSGRELLERLYSVGRTDLVEFVRKNPQFVSRFILPGR